MSFTTTPGARFYSDGPNSGQEFKDKFLRPAFDRAVARDVELEVNLDGADGFATSFLEEAFGGLARDVGIESVLSRLVIICTDEPGLDDEIKDYVRKANTRGPRAKR